MSHSLLRCASMSFVSPSAVTLQRFLAKPIVELLPAAAAPAPALYDSVPAARTKRAQLAGQAERLFRQQLDLFGQVNENMNGVLGVGSDSARADSYYHWGALNALVAIAERGLYPSPMLAGVSLAK